VDFRDRPVRWPVGQHRSREYDPNDFKVTPRGAFTLTRTDCDTLVFDYDSDVEGYGSATRNYTRLSKLNLNIHLPMLFPKKKAPG